VFEIFIVDSPFNLKVGSQVQVTLSVDGRDLGEYTMKTKKKSGYAIIQSNADRLITAFKHGRQFSLRFAGNVVRFSLKGTYAGLSNLERCAAKNKRTTEGRQADPIQANQGTGGSAAAPAATRTNPFLTKQGPAAAPVAPATITPPSASAAGPSARVLADRRRFFNHGAADDSAFINRLLDSVGLREFASIPPGSAQMFSDAAFYVWSDRLIEGGVTKVDLSVLSVAEAAKFMAENLDRLVCERGFDYRIRVVRMDSGASARRVNGLCLVGEHDLAVAMLP